MREPRNVSIERAIRIASKQDNEELPTWIWMGSVDTGCFYMSESTTEVESILLQVINFMQAMHQQFVNARFESNWKDMSAEYGMVEDDGMNDTLVMQIGEPKTHYKKHTDCRPGLHVPPNETDDAGNVEKRLSAFHQVVFTLCFQNHPRRSTGVRWFANTNPKKAIATIVCEPGFFLHVQLIGTQLYTEHEVRHCNN